MLSLRRFNFNLKPTKSSCVAHYKRRNPVWRRMCGRLPTKPEKKNLGLVLLRRFSPPERRVRRVGEPPRPSPSGGHRLCLAAVAIAAARRWNSRRDSRLLPSSDGTERSMKSTSSRHNAAICSRQQLRELEFSQRAECRSLLDAPLAASTGRPARHHSQSRINLG